ncbi:MAG TPA: cytochrome c [Terriglobales bacterium]|nr:cytochrome c [Terriglobales bacterium]
MQASKWFGLSAVILALAMIAMAQQAAPSQEKVIKHAPVKPTSAASGQEMYSSYCAVCHGLDGKGAGPAASALKVPPSDLTALAAQNGGKYPSLHISSVLRGEAETPAHGSKDMPVWGPLFRHLSLGHDAEVQQRIANLNQYIDSIQKK